MLKFNPFQPGSVVAPGMFTGRAEEIQSIEQCLFQTKHGNPQSFFVTGERGIGKSSLLVYINSVLSQGVPGLHGVAFNFLTVPINCSGCGSPIDLIQRIARGLKNCLLQHRDRKEQASSLWNLITNWEIMGSKYVVESGEDFIDAAIDDIVAKIVHFFDADIQEIVGILFLIDEADESAECIELGSFLKSFSEKLSWADCKQVCFGLAGLPGLIDSLSASHDSSPRLFEIMDLKPLMDDERRAVIARCLTQANEKNENSTVIEPKAEQALCDISEGYPHFLQQFGYCAFRADQDFTIDLEDVMKGAFDEHGALDQLGQKFFNKMYTEQIFSDDYRKVLHTMAKSGDAWISKADLVKNSGVSVSQVGNALTSLKSKEIIIHDEAVKGRYRLPTKSFAVWINAKEQQFEI